jgi:quinol monooxygenase YgiN
MVRLTVALHAASARSGQELLDTLRFLMTSTRLEDGCQECHAWLDPDFTVHYLERWATEDDMRRRVRSPSFTSLLVVMEHARDTPEVQFDFVTTTRGLDFVAEVRGELLS